MIISLDFENFIVKIQPILVKVFMIEVLERSWIKEVYLNILKQHQIKWRKPQSDFY